MPRRKKTPVTVLKPPKKKRIPTDPLDARFASPPPVGPAPLIEKRRQIEMIEGLMVLGSSNYQIRQVVTKPPAQGGLGISRHTCEKRIQEIKIRWEQEDKDRSSSRRTEQSRRILRQIQNCQGRRDPANPHKWAEKPDHQALVRYERLLAEIQGTMAPVEIDVRAVVTESLAASFAAYDLDKLQELHEAAETRHMMAQEYVREHPEMAPAERAKVLGPADL